MPPKRKLVVDQPKINTTLDGTYVVIETIEGDGDVFVQFVPRCWLRQVSKKKPIELREAAMYFFPVRLDNQSREEHLNFVKHAKFICQQPKNDKNWELRHCRVLKIGIDSLEGAIHAEQLFSVYFHTTDAELHMQEPPSRKRMRKVKKGRARKELIESESEDDDVRMTAQTTGIGDYNSSIVKSITSDNVSAMDTINQSKIASVDIADDNCIALDMRTCNILPVSGENTIAFPPVAVQRTFSPQLDVNNASDLHTFNLESIEEAVINEVDNEHQGVVIEFIDKQTSSVTNDKCKCSQKIMNKIDYFQKKVLKQLGLYRQETAKSIRELSDRVDVLLNSDHIQEQIADGTITLDDEFEDQFRGMFPVKVNSMLVEVNNKIKNERDFKKRLLLKLNQKTEENEMKATRKILKTLCNGSCLSGFTWTGSSMGTIKKLSFMSLEPVIDVITQVVKDQFPQCEPYGILKCVVQQRTKSANDSNPKKKQSETQVEYSNGTDQTSKIENQDLNSLDYSVDGSVTDNQADIVPKTSNAGGLETDQRQDNE